MYKTITKIALFLSACTAAIDASELTLFQKLNSFYWKYNFKGQIIQPSSNVIINHFIAYKNQKAAAYGSEEVKTESLRNLFTQHLLALKLNLADIKIYAIRTDWVDQYRAQGIYMMQADRAIWIDEEFFITELNEKQQEAAIAYLCLAIESNYARWDSLMAGVTAVVAVGLNLVLEKSAYKHIPYISQDQSQWGPYLSNWTAYLAAVYAAQYANKMMLRLWQKQRLDSLCKKYVAMGNNTQDLIEVLTLSDEMSGSDRFLAAITSLKKHTA